VNEADIGKHQYAHPELIFLCSFQPFRLL